MASVVHMAGDQLQLQQEIPYQVLRVALRAAQSLDELCSG